MKLKESVTAPIPVLAAYGLYYLFFISPVVRNTLSGAGDYTLLSGIVLELVALFLPAAIYSRAKGIGYSAKMNFAAFRPSRIVFAVCALICCLCAAVLVAMGVDALGIAGRYSLVDTYALSLYDAGISPALRAVAYAAVPAIAEEFLYRGVLVTEFRCHGLFPAIFFPAVLFALGQFSLVKLPAFFLLGVMMSLVYYVTDSLPITVLTRMIFNVLVFYFEGAAWSLIQRRSNYVFFMCLCIVLFLTCLMLALSEAQRTLYTKGLDARPTPPEGMVESRLPVRFLQTLLSPTFILCVAGALCVMLL